MAGPIASFVQLPLDTGNTGKKVRTQTRVIGANTVHEHFFIQALQREVLGAYSLGMAQQAVQAAAQNGTTTGFLWFHVPTAITNKKARVRRLSFDTSISAATAMPTAPRLAMSRMTFTGTASGASVSGVKRDATFPAHVADLRTAVTGLTVTLVGVITAKHFVGLPTAVGAVPPVEMNLIDIASLEYDWPVFAPGEGFVLWQDIAGTTADVRRFNPNVLWDEIDTAP